MASSTPACSSTHCGSESLWSANASRGVALTGDREVEIRTLSGLCPGTGEVVIATQASGLCGRDLRHCRAAKADRSDPASLKVAGYEPGGVIDAIGPGVAEVAIGDRVMMHHYAGCRLFDAGSTGKVCFTWD